MPKSTNYSNREVIVYIVNIKPTTFFTLKKYQQIIKSSFFYCVIFPLVFLL